MMEFFKAFFTMGAPAAMAIGAAGATVAALVAIRSIRRVSEMREIGRNQIELERMRRDRVREIDAKRAPPED